MVATVDIEFHVVASSDAGNGRCAAAGRNDRRERIAGPRRRAETLARNRSVRLA
jgi:hypothetical protein